MKKEEVSEKLNILMKSDIDFKKLTKEDLEKLYNYFNDPQNILNSLFEILGPEKFIEELKKFVINKGLEEKPIRKILRELILK